MTKTAIRPQAIAAIINTTSVRGDYDMEIEGHFIDVLADGGITVQYLPPQGAGRDEARKAANRAAARTRRLVKKLTDLGYIVDRYATDAFDVHGDADRA